MFSILSFAIVELRCLSELDFSTSLGKMLYMSGENKLIALRHEIIIEPIKIPHFICDHHTRYMCLTPFPVALQRSYGNGWVSPCDTGMLSETTI